MWIVILHIRRFGKMAFAKSGLCLIAVLFGFNVVYAQFEDAQVRDTHIAFLKVYFGARDQQQTDQNTIRSILEHFDISNARYGQIIRAAVKTQDITLSDDEILALDSLQNLKRQDQARLEARLKALCRAENIAYSRYLDILRKYRTDIAFQRALQPLVSRHILNEY